WGDVEWSSFHNAFNGTSHLKITATGSQVPNLDNVGNMNLAFANSGIGDSNNFSYWDVGNVTSMYGMFQNSQDFNSPLFAWDVSNVTDMGYMFDGASSYNSPMNSWDTGNVVYMNAMFRNASSFDKSLKDWDVSKVKYANEMFKNASSFDRH